MLLLLNYLLHTFLIRNDLYLSMNFPSYEAYENVYELVLNATDCKNTPKMRRQEEPRRVTR